MQATDVEAQESDCSCLQRSIRSKLGSSRGALIVTFECSKLMHLDDKSKLCMFDKCPRTKIASNSNVFKFKFGARLEFVHILFNRELWPYKRIQELCLGRTTLS